MRYFYIINISHGANTLFHQDEIVLVMHQNNIYHYCRAFWIWKCLLEVEMRGRKFEDVWKMFYKTNHHLHAGLFMKEEK